MTKGSQIMTKGIPRSLLDVPTFFGGIQFTNLLCTPMSHLGCDRLVGWFAGTKLLAHLEDLFVFVSAEGKYKSLRSEKLQFEIFTGIALYRRLTRGMTPGALIGSKHAQVKQPGNCQSFSSQDKPTTKIMNHFSTRTNISYPMFIEPTNTSGSFGVLWVHVAWYKKLCWKKYTIALLYYYYYYFEHFSAQVNTGTANALM